MFGNTPQCPLLNGDFHFIFPSTGEYTPNRHLCLPWWPHNLAHPRASLLQALAAPASFRRFSRWSLRIALGLRGMLGVTEELRCGTAVVVVDRGREAHGGTLKGAPRCCCA